MTIPIKIWGPIFWAADRDEITFYDDVAGEIIIADLNEMSVERVSVRKYGISMWEVAWNSGCECFYYQLEMNTRNAYDFYSTKAKVYKIVGGDLVLVPDVNTLSSSPDGKYYYESVGLDTIGNEFNIYASNGARLGGYEVDYFIDWRTRKMWGDKRLRVLGVQGLFDMAAGNDIDVFRKAWFRKKGEESDMQGIFYKDVAADKSRYVLMVDRSNDTKYVVQDIQTGKVVKTYEKFW